MADNASTVMCPTARPKRGMRPDESHRDCRQEGGDDKAAVD
jgi:hypothetical protein